METKVPEEAYLQRQFERNQAQALETMRVREAKRKEFLERSRIGGEGDSCLAYAVETGACAISAPEFDRDLVSQLPDSLELQSGESLALQAARARRSVFEQLIDRAFLDAYRPDDSLRIPASEARKIHPVNRLINRPIHQIEPRGSFAGYAVPTLLRAFPEIRAQVVAASDSAWLAAWLGNPRGGLLPVTLAARELPDSVAAILVRLPRGEWTPILRVPFGFLVCSWLDTLPAPAMLAKIRPRLGPSGSESGAQDRSRALDSLRRHGEWCLDEDTLALSLRLTPALRGKAQEVREFREPGPAWLRANSSVLPASVQSKLWAKIDQGGPDTLGPFRSVYGTWMLAPSSRETKRGRTLDPSACLARAEAMLKQAAYAKRIRSEWETMAAKMGSDRDGENGEARTALLEQLAKQGAQPESSYFKIREQWASRSLRFTRNLGFLDAAPESGHGKGE